MDGLSDFELSRYNITQAILIHRIWQCLNLAVPKFSSHKAEISSHKFSSLKAEFSVTNSAAAKFSSTPNSSAVNNTTYHHTTIQMQDSEVAFCSVNTVACKINAQSILIPQIWEEKVQS